MAQVQLKENIVHALEEAKARDIVVLDVSQISSFTDWMVVATGTSTTHVRSTGESVAQAFKASEHPPLGVETDPSPNWVVVDLGQAVIHIMTESARAHYQLEKLWDMPPQSVQAHHPSDLLE